MWVSGADRELAKIAAIGVRVRKWVTLHGLALNVDPDMSHFGLIVPCGLHGRAVASMAGLGAAGEVHEAGRRVAERVAALLATPSSARHRAG